MRDFIGALAEYAAIVGNIAKDYDDTVIVKTIRAGHPELDFMDDEEIETVLHQVSVFRKRR